LTTTADLHIPLCPNKPGMVSVDPVTGETWPLHCELLSCQVCLRRQAARYARAIACCRPEHFITFTRVGTDWKQIQPRVNKLRRSMRSRLPRWQDVFHVERDRGGVPHAHMWQWGGDVSPALAREMAIRAGMGGVVNVQRCRSRVPAVYGLKTIVNSPVAEGITPAIADFLELNGERLAHPTRWILAGRARQPSARFQGSRSALPRSQGDLRRGSPLTKTLTELERE